MTKQPSWRRGLTPALRGKRVYQLLVYFPDKDVPHAIIYVNTAAEVLSVIPHLFAEHEGCEHIVVMLGAARPFSVNCAGNSMP